ncbi:nuclear transport factor 2 family protein [Saccharopolyspora oryzae]|uniref:Nuclear transport factor 2 family protein n=1 Tax=Saccharopolyspora oryzae TaxID=2997343 RepID=A0ABT4UU34_9PSEU|nr:nuclear transport factor 2 family protein [Saccharopolyspora oryzae]MDA3624706.1 nuclear transport factor 2 family protein [Saccharopolyspora oryzae]
MTGSPVPPELYAEVLHFYARQMQALDGGDFESYAATFTADGTFKHSPKLPAAQTRQGITEALHEFHKKFDGDPVQRRHYFNHVVLEQQEDGSLSSTAYALVLTTRPGGRPDVGPSCVVNDVIVRDRGALRLKSRAVDHDQEFAAVAV